MSRPNNRLLADIMLHHALGDSARAHLLYDEAMEEKLEDLDPEWFAALRNAYGALAKWY